MMGVGVSHRVAALAVTLVAAGCGGGSTPAPPATPTLAPPPAAEAAPPVQPNGLPAMTLPWPARDAGGAPTYHTWTGGPHGYWRDANGAGNTCLPNNICAKEVPTDRRSGLDFGTGVVNGTGRADWDVYPVAAGAIIYKGPFTNEFGAGVIINHGGVFTVYAHMDEASLADAPDPAEPGQPPTTVSRATKLGRTWCTGLVDEKGNAACSAESMNHHLHLELRKSIVATRAGVTSWGTPETWNGVTIGGWLIMKATLNYYGSATACDTTLTVDAGPVPVIADAADCSTVAAAGLRPPDVAEPPVEFTPPTSQPGSAEFTFPTPTPAPLTLAGSWVTPKNGSTLKSYTLAFSAKPRASLEGTPISKVVYNASWPGGKKTACTAKAAGSSGTWSCTADLVALGIPPGKVAFTFDVWAGPENVARAVDGTRTVTYAVAPPKPTGTSMRRVGEVAHEAYFTITEKVAWSEPAGYATGFRLYFYTACPNYSRSNPKQPCLVEHMPLRSDDLHLVAEAKGTARALKFSLNEGGQCYMGMFCLGVGAVLLQATNAYGSSVITIVETSPSKDWIP